MRLADALRLVGLAAIWGGSFIFMRVTAPALGAIVTTTLRVFVGAFLLFLYFRWIGFSVDWSKHGKTYLLIGAVNTAIPFSLFAFAARHIPAGYSVILNASVPLFALAFSAIWLGERITGKKAFGLILGIGGVVCIIGAKPIGGADGAFLLSILACLLASACYALAGVLIRKLARQIRPMALAGACQLAAGFVLLPLCPFSPPSAWPPTAGVLGCLFGLGALCSGVAYLLYYRLVADIGPTKALTVTFLMPVFGMLWGRLFLNEPVTARMVLGCGLILLGTCLVFNFIGLPGRRMEGR